MSNEAQNGGRSDYTDRLPNGPPACWLCNRPHAGALTVLGGRVGRTTKIPVCAAGEGCQDGRIYHGTLAPPHFPDRPCERCGPTARTRNQRHRP
jgi:hypothetical protein